MKILVTGATGYIGTVVVEKLLAAGHAVAGLARSDEAAAKLSRAGAEAARGSLADGESITAAARGAGAVIHLAMEFSAEALVRDRTAIDAILSGLKNGAAFVYTSGIWVLGSTGSAVADENTVLSPTPLVAWRPVHERSVLGAGGVRGIVIRPGMVWGRGGGAAGGFVAEARKQGVVHVVGDGGNRWPFVHVDDLADLYVLALGAPGGSLYFAAAGEAVAVRDVARAAAGGVPVEYVPLEQARQTMGLMADALTLDQQVSADKARRELHWNPTHLSILKEIAA